MPLDLIRRILTIAAAVVGLSHAPVRAQNALADEGLFVTVPSPLTSDGVTRIKNRVEAAVNHPIRPVHKIVFDFTPTGKEATSSDFGTCYDLAFYISRQQSVTTVAFVSGSASGHLVLPVLACKDLAMSAKASLGEIVPPGGPVPGKAIEVGYEEILGTSREQYWAIAKKMYDRGVSVGKGLTKEGAVFYVDLRDKAKHEKAGILIPDPTPLPFAGPGAPGQFTTANLKQVGLCKVTAETRKQLAELYELSAASLRDDPLDGRPPVAFHYTLRGPVDGGVKEAVARVVQDVARQKGNVLFLQLECSGGELSAARDLADKLIEARTGENPVLIVAFIPDRAPDTAAIIALGCGEIVMSHRSGMKDANGDPEEADFGDFEAFVGRDPSKANLLKQSLKDLAGKQGFPELLVEGMVDRDLVIVRAHGAVERGRRRLMTGAQFDAEKADWVSDGIVKPKGQLLKLNATKAVELGLARFVVDGREPAEAYNLYGIDPSKVREAKPSWIDRFAEFLRIPGVTVLLVVIGFAGLILELKVPGTTVPGIIAALSFILVFWAHSQFSGQNAILGGLIFMLGLVLILLEVFVIPGFGIPGVLGLLFMLAGVGLATFDKIPQSGDEWTAFGGRVVEYVGALAAGVALAFAVARFLPKIPYANRLMLQPPMEQPEIDSPAVTEAMAMLGAIGTAATPLRPAGMAQFGDRYVDVVSEGGFINAGARVQVVEVEGTRVVVKDV